MCASNQDCNTNRYRQQQRRCPSNALPPPLFCNYTSEMLKTLKDVGSDDKHSPLKLYKTLVSTSVDAFSSEIMLYHFQIHLINNINHLKRS
eukprot:10843048-Ditylum_brightwellii.AAC.1